MKPKGFAITINTRFQSKNIFKAWAEMAEQILEHPDAFLPAHLVREVLTKEANFDAAYKQLSTRRIIGSVYYTLSGVKLGQGHVLARGQNSVARDVAIGKMTPDWFVLQTVRYS